MMKKSSLSVTVRETDCLPNKDQEKLMKMRPLQAHREVCARATSHPLNAPSSHASECHLSDTPGEKQRNEAKGGALAFRNLV